MPLQRIKQKIKKYLLLLATKKKGGLRFVIIMRSGRNLLLANIFGGYNGTLSSSKADENDIKAAMQEARIAYNQGQHRLALLLAHQCDCVSEHPANPKIEALLAELGQEQTAIN
jgi:hypothetical protein